MLLLAFVMAFLLTLLLASTYSPLKVLDTPNARSLHDTPTPRSGGVAMMLSIFFTWGLSAWFGGLPPVMLWVMLSAGLVAVVSFVDDVIELSALQRIIVHALSATLLLVGGLGLGNQLLWLLFTWLAIVWMLNLYNFMDGMDGLAAGMACFGFGFMALAGWLAGAELYAQYAAVIVLAALGFLLVNFPPARIFMGDTGSATLGLLAAAFSLWGIREGIFDWWFPLLVFSPFVVDATVTLMRRILKRERIWEAHRSHFYQQLVQAGWGHKKTVMAEYLVMCLCGISAVLMQQLASSLWVGLLLLFWIVIYGGMMIFIRRYVMRLGL